METVDSISTFHDELTEWRHAIHAHPELGFQEQRTSDLVADKLAGFGIEVHRGLGKTGVVGRLRIGNSPRSTTSMDRCCSVWATLFWAPARTPKMPYKVSS